jgi:coenzyme F420-0:L-glutamate ligase/coenzyme F420-1:gamma-L-glutamate ligase
LKDDITSIMGAMLGEDLIADGLAVDTIERDATRSYRRITSAPLLILVCLSMEDMDHYSDDRRQQYEATMAIQSTAMAGQNLLLAAQALDLGACWMCAPLFCPGDVKWCQQIPASWQPQGLIAVGYAAETREKTRRPIAELIQYRP